MNLEAKEIQKAIEEAKKIVITGHRSPDGDSIGSSLGLYRFLVSEGKNVSICHPDPCPKFLAWMKGEDIIFDFETDREKVTEELISADLIFSLDYNGANRLGKEMGEVFLQTSAKKIMIDHHLDPEAIFDIAVSQPSVCSTSELIIELILQLSEKEKIDPKMGTPLYLGVVTDTGSFRFSSVSARTHELMAILLASGVKQSEIHEQTFDNNRLDKLQLRGFAIAEKLELLLDLKVAIISLTLEELRRFNYVKGDTEGLVNVALSIEGVEVAVFLSEAEDRIKFSFRSIGDIAVNEIAGEHFQGGGHKNAAGGMFVGTMEDAIFRLKEVLPLFL